MTEVVIRSHSPSPSNHHFASPSSSRPGLQRRHRFEGCSDSERDGGDQVSLLEVLAAAFRKSLVGCSVVPFGGEEAFGMEIGFPTDVRHVAHVTFDRFDGFLGLPVEFEPEVSRTAPSASTTVFGVSTDSMQLSYDSRGNSVPTILLLMQRYLYAQCGLQAEGIFRINADNGQEEYVRDQLNRGVIPEGIDVHCLASLIKAWFRELPTGILDTLSPEQIMESESEDDCAQLVGLLPPMEAALLDWAINLMADVSQYEHLNKMNARNIAVVFAPNMTKMAEPLTALMYAVQVMNFLKTLIMRTLRGREDPVIESLSPSLSLDPSDDIEPQSTLFRSLPLEACEETEEKLHVTQKPTPDEIEPQSTLFRSLPLEACEETEEKLHVTQKPTPDEKESQELPLVQKDEVVSQVNSLKQEIRRVDVIPSRPNSGSLRKSSRNRNVNNKRGSTRVASLDKGKGGSSISSRMNSRVELVESWR